MLSKRIGHVLVVAALTPLSRVPALVRRLRTIGCTAEQEYDLWVLVERQYREYHREDKDHWSDMLYLCNFVHHLHAQGLLSHWQHKCLRARIRRQLTLDSGEYVYDLTSYSRRYGLPGTACKGLEARVGHPIELGLSLQQLYRVNAEVREAWIAKWIMHDCFKEFA